ncbi:Crp/Fnr family transcriptional regulator [Desulfotalea psychrophila]|uniref:Probable transcription regulator (Fnr-like) n=1 Tax=Desulfotalea psychrophila (strain LSv54 / DSM 12343) TaxID=177439 RepID=Q6AL49_DESPS|nr:Crp/Fnr family transcriptional regulator [Desulfotalea psychrophila]CAG36926.1 probable transcription regulator (Fnr-like) [Desulfotalea psychrophila LSv54]
MNIESILANCELFAGLPGEQLAQLATITKEISVKRGTSLFFEQDPGNGFYLIVSGRVKVYKISAGGKEQILHILKDLETFGEAAVFQGKPFPANGESLVDTELLYFPREKFVSLIERNSQLALNLLAIFATKLRKFTRQVEALSLQEVPHRLAKYLLLLTEEQDSLSLRLEISKGQLASLLGTAPETLSRIFGQFASEGIIVIHGRAIEVVDKGKLKEKVED